MASNLPENLVGDMMSNAPRFTLPNFGAQNRPAPRPAAPAPQEPVQDIFPLPDDGSCCICSAHMAGCVPLSRHAERCNGGMVWRSSCGLDEIKQMYDSGSSAVFVEKSRL